MRYKSNRNNSFAKLFELPNSDENKSESEVNLDKDISTKKKTVERNSLSWQFILFFSSLTAALIIVPMIVKSNNESMVATKPKEPSSLPISTPVKSIIHIQGDDRSDSAINNQDLQSLHCQFSRDHYQIGDTRAVISFASEAKTIDKTSIESRATENICGYQLNRNQINLRSGTSLILALEHILYLVESFRGKGQLNNVLVTLTIHEAEPGPEQPLMNTEGLKRLRETIENLQREKTFIVIIGAKGELKQQLMKHFKLSPYQRLCVGNEMSECISQAFRATRNWNY